VIVLVCSEMRSAAPVASEADRRTRGKHVAGVFAHIISAESKIVATRMFLSPRIVPGVLKREEVLNVIGVCERRFGDRA
jgi:hypothetical protein